MPLTYDLVASVTTTSDASTIEITSLPTTYTDLIIVGFINGFDVTTGSPYIGVRLNGDTANNYRYTSLYNTSSDYNDSNNSGPIAAAGVGVTSTSMPVSYVAHLMNFRGSKYKNVVSRAGISVGNGPENINTTTWRNTGTVTSVSFGLFYTVGKMKSGSSVEIYGVQKA